jgi:hypothetical protein
MAYCESGTLVVVILLLVTFDYVGKVLGVYNLQVVSQLLPLFQTIEYESELVTLK